MPTSIQKLGTAPSVDAVNEWLLELGWNRDVVGNSVQGRDVVAYSYDFWTNTSEQETIQPVATVMFMSLTHGNEPMGLLSLLSTVQLLSRPPSLRQRRQQQQTPTRVVVVPVVNVDAYIWNLQAISGGNFPERGCRRTNLRHLNCSSIGVEQQQQEAFSSASSCSSRTTDGVDLNRNFPTDWQPATQEILIKKNPKLQPCGTQYGGDTAFSEPETRAVRTAVQRYNVTHVLSFHSMSSIERPRLLIHPYTSSRPFSQMPAKRAAIYRKWSAIMNTGGEDGSSSSSSTDYYRTGTALETIGYTAAGSSIDWLDSFLGIYAFVIEAVPPCDHRWCYKHRTRVFHEARLNAVTAERLVQLAATGQVVDDSLYRFLLFVIGLAAVYMVWQKRRRLRRQWSYHPRGLLVPFCLRRLGRKVKQHGIEEEETELQLLNTSNNKESAVFDSRRLIL